MIMHVMFLCYVFLSLSSEFGKHVDNSKHTALSYLLTCTTTVCIISSDESLFIGRNQF